MMAGLLTAREVYRHLKGGSSMRQKAEAWRRRHVAAGRTEYGAPLVEDATPMMAYVNHGRWLVDCLCGNGVPTEPPDLGTVEATCISCGTVWTHIVFPHNRDEIETLLLARRFTPHRNWSPDMTAARLRAEDVEFAATRARR